MSFSLSWIRTTSNFVGIKLLVIAILCLLCSGCDLSPEMEELGHDGLVRADGYDYKVRIHSAELVSQTYDTAFVRLTYDYRGPRSKIRSQIYSRKRLVEGFDSPIVSFPEGENLTVRMAVYFQPTSGGSETHSEVLRLRFFDGRPEPFHEGEYKLVRKWCTQECNF